jgi:hypothetical protein
MKARDRGGDRHIDIAPDRIRDRQSMNTLRRPFSGALVDAGDGHCKRGDQHEASCLISIRAATASISSSEERWPASQVT